MEYLVPFAALKNVIKIVSLKGQLRVDMTYDELLDLIRQFLHAVPVDEAWYRATYDDVAHAIDSGTYRDAKHHFVSNGYMEGRRPFPVKIDEEWYLNTNPDVKSGIAEGAFESAQEHFNQHGYDEGRKPAPM